MYNLRMSIMVSILICKTLFATIAYRPPYSFLSTSMSMPIAPVLLQHFKPLFLQKDGQGMTSNPEKFFPGFILFAKR